MTAAEKFWAQYVPGTYDKPQRVEDALIDRHNRNFRHAGDPPFEAQRIAVAESLSLLPRFEGYRCWLNLIGGTVLYMAASNEECDAVIDTALWCGSPHVEVEYCLPGRIVTETWAAVS